MQEENSKSKKTIAIKKIYIVLGMRTASCALRLRRRTQLCSILIIEICITNYKKYLVVDIELFFKAASCLSRRNFSSLLWLRFSTETAMTLVQGGNLNELSLARSFSLTSEQSDLLTQTRTRSNVKKTKNSIICLLNGI